MLKSKELIVATSLVSLLALPFVASAATLTASCTGIPSTTSITWTASSTGGVLPVAYLWGNSSTSTAQTIVVTPGSYSMNLQVTDASSTVATTTCSATVAAPIPPGPSLAEQIAAVTNQINALKIQLAQLLAQQANNTATSTPSGCFNFRDDLEEGDDGDDVRNLQTTLASDSSIFPAGLITGFFGPLTREGVRKFQEKHGISSTGYFGPRSRAFFESQCSSGDSDHNGVPDSIDDEDEQDSSRDRSSATSTISDERSSNSSQTNRERNNDSSRENRDQEGDDSNDD